MEHAYKTKVQKMRKDKNKSKNFLQIWGTIQQPYKKKKKKKKKGNFFNVNENSEVSSLGTEPILWYVN